MIGCFSRTPHLRQWCCQVVFFYFDNNGLHRRLTRDWAVSAFDPPLFSLCVVLDLIYLCKIKKNKKKLCSQQYRSGLNKYCDTYQTQPLHPHTQLIPKANFFHLSWACSIWHNIEFRHCWSSSKVPELLKYSMLCCTGKSGADFVTLVVFQVCNWRIPKKKKNLKNFL